MVSVELLGGCPNLSSQAVDTDENPVILLYKVTCVCNSESVCTNRKLELKFMKTELGKVNEFNTKNIWAI